jgi:hypothetical protein
MYRAFPFSKGTLEHVYLKMLGEIVNFTIVKLPKTLTNQSPLDVIWVDFWASLVISRSNVVN